MEITSLNFNESYLNESFFDDIEDNIYNDDKSDTLSMMTDTFLIKEAEKNLNKILPNNILFKLNTQDKVLEITMHSCVISAKIFQKVLDVCNNINYNIATLKQIEIHGDPLKPISIDGHNITISSILYEKTFSSITLFNIKSITNIIIYNYSSVSLGRTHIIYPDTVKIKTNELYIVNSKISNYTFIKHVVNVYISISDNPDDIKSKLQFPAILGDCDIDVIKFNFEYEYKYFSNPIILYNFPQNCKQIIFMSALDNLENLHFTNVTNLGNTLVRLNSNNTYVLSDKKIVIKNTDIDLINIIKTYSKDITYCDYDIAIPQKVITMMKNANSYQLQLLPNYK